MIAKPIDARSRIHEIRNAIKITSELSGTRFYFFACSEVTATADQFNATRNPIGLSNLKFGIDSFVERLDSVLSTRRLPCRRNILSAYRKRNLKQQRNWFNFFKAPVKGFVGLKYCFGPIRTGRIGRTLGLPRRIAAAGKRLRMFDSVLLSGDFRNASI